MHQLLELFELLHYLCVLEADVLGRVAVTGFVARGAAQVVGTEAASVDLKVVETRIAGTVAGDIGVVQTTVGTGGAEEFLTLSQNLVDRSHL